MKAVKWLVLAGAVGLVLIGLALGGMDKLVGFFSEPAPDLASPKTFSADGVALSYPGNWTIKSKDGGASGIRIRTLTIESPGSTLALVQSFRPAIDVDMDDYLKSFVSGFEEELSSSYAGLIESGDVTTTELEGELAGVSITGKRLQLSLSLLNERVPFTIEIRRVKGEELTLVLVTMVSDEDQAVAQPGLDLVRDSLRLE